VGSVGLNSYWAIVADVRLEAGTFVGAAVLLRARGPATSADFRVSLAGEFGNGTVGRTYRLRRIVKVTGPADVSYMQLFAMSHWSPVGSTAAANDITWFGCGARPATA